MPKAHRLNDERFCGAVTTPVSQSTVFVNGKLWALQGDPDSHGAGNLICVYGPKNVFINGKHVIVAVGDQAAPDNFPHLPPDTYPKGSSPNVYVYE